MGKSSDSWQLPDPRVLQASPPQAGQMLESQLREPEGGGELGTRPLRAGEKTGPAAYRFPKLGPGLYPPPMLDKSFPCSGAGEGEGAFLVGDIIRDLQLPLLPGPHPGPPGPARPPPLCPPATRPAPARTKLAPGRLGPPRGLHAVPGFQALGPGRRPPGSSGLLPAWTGAPGGSGAGGRAAAGPGRARGGLRAGLTPCWPRCARAPARGERAQGCRAARLPRSAPTSPSVAVRGVRSGGSGRARCGGPASAGAGPGAASRAGSLASTRILPRLSRPIRCCSATT